MRNQQSIIIILFAAVFFTHCKKQTFINDTGTNYFMVAIQGTTSGGEKISATRYNENPQNVIIGEDSIIFKQAGLYHFEGNIYIDCLRINPSLAVNYALLIHVKDRYFPVAHGFTDRVGGTDAASSSFSIDVPVEANGGVYLRRSVDNGVSGLVLIRWNGYMIRKM